MHSDIIGPIKYKSLAGSYYVLTLLDDSNGASWVKFLQKKSDAQDSIPEIIKMAENTTKKKIVYFKSDNGLEYNSRSFLSELGALGIQALRTPPYPFESNGKAERLNRTILDGARTMFRKPKYPMTAHFYGRKS